MCDSMDEVLSGCRRAAGMAGLLLVVGFLLSLPAADRVAVAAQIQEAPATAPAGAVRPGPATRVRDRLLVYHDRDGAEQPIRDARTWRQRRAEILAGVQEVMGPLPPRPETPPEMLVVERVPADGYTRMGVTIIPEPGDLMPAFLLMPTGLPADQRRPAILALHQTVEIGKGEPAGLGKNPNLQYGHELAQRGYVVLIPDYPSFGDYTYDYTKDRYPSGSIKGVLNHMRCVDLLCALPEVDPKRIGVIGHSLGGHNAMFVGLFDERLAVIVSSCGWTPFHDYYEGKLEGWTSERYMPRIRDVYEGDADRLPFDFYEVVAGFAPRAFFSSSPLRDDNFAAAGVKKAEAAVRPVYALLGAADRLQIRYPESEHDFPVETRREAYAFVDRILDHKPARQVP